MLQSSLLILNQSCGRFQFWAYPKVETAALFQFWAASTFGPAQGKRLLTVIFLFLPMPFVSIVNDQSGLPRSLAIDDQCLDEVMFCLKTDKMFDVS